MIGRIKAKMEKYRRTLSGDAYIEYLRSKGVKVGKGTIVNNPKNIHVDCSHPELVEIGENVLLHSGTTILSHDYASRAFVNLYNDYIPAHEKVKIGNNVWLGQNVTILKGVTIGNNVVIGYGSIVSKSIPSNSVAVGAPAKVICTFEEYYKKRCDRYVEETIKMANSIYESGRTPVIADFYEDYPAFVDARNYKDYPYDYSRQFTKPEQFEQWLKMHHAPFCGFDEFMSEVNRRRVAQSC